MDLSELKVPHLSNDEIRESADGLRNEFTAGEIPVDVEIICERAGIEITPVNNIMYLLGMDAALANNSSEIFIDFRAPEVRFRFSIAHELGHHMLHSEQMSEMNPTSYEDWSEIIDTIPHYLFKRMESQANKFAGYLLVPVDDLIIEFKKIRENLIKAKKYIRHFSQTYEWIAPILSRKFNISEQCMLIQLKIEELNPYDFI